MTSTFRGTLRLEGKRLTKIEDEVRPRARIRHGRLAIRPSTLRPRSPSRDDFGSDNVRSECDDYNDKGNEEEEEETGGI